MNEKIANFIKSNYKNMSISDLAKKLALSEKEVSKIITELGLDKKNGTFKNAITSPNIYKAYALTRTDYWLSILVFIISMVVYCYTSAPGICTKDTGELASAVFFLGGAHSPGYPLFCVVGKFFMNMLPFLGQAIYRLNIFDAFAGAVTIAGLFLVLVKLLGRTLHPEEEEFRNGLPNHLWMLTRLPAIAASLYFAFSQIFWSQAILAEVYTLQSIFVPFFLLILLRWNETLIAKPDLLDRDGSFWNQTSKLLYAFYFLLGFSMGGHHTMIGIMMPTFFFILSRYVSKKHFPIVIILFSIGYFSILFNILMPVVPKMVIILCFLAGSIIVIASRPKSIPTYILIVLFFLLGLLIYAYLPIRGQAYAPLHWGNPTTLENFQNVVLRKQYQGMTQASDLLSISYRAGQIFTWFKWRLDQFTIPLFLLVIPGLISLYRRNRRWFWFTTSFILYYDGGLLLFNNFQFSSRDQYFAGIFWIISYMITTIWIAYGISFLIEHLVKWLRKTGKSVLPFGIAAGIIAIFLSLLPFSTHFMANNYHHNAENHNYGLNMLKTLDKNAILFTEGGDNQVFSLLYLHLVEHIRPDVTIWDQKGNVFEGLYGDMMRISQQQLTENNITGDYSQWATGRPIFYTWREYSRINEINRRYYISKGAAPRDLQSIGILYRIIPARTAYSPLINYWDYYNFPWREYPNEAVHWDYLTREICANYNFQLGDYYAYLAETNPATMAKYGALSEESYNKAAFFGYDMVAIHFNLAIFLEQKAYQAIRQNNNAKALKLYDQAIIRYQDAIKSDEQELRTYNNLVALYERKASLDWRNEPTYMSNAKKIVEKCLKQNPNYDQAKNNLIRINGKLEYPISVLNEIQNQVIKNPRNKTAVDKMLDALIKRGEIEATESFLASILPYYPPDWKYLQTLASINAQLQRPEKTVYYLQQLAKMQPNNAGIWLNIAEIQYTRLGQIRQAEANYTKILQMGAANPQFGQIINQAQQRLVEINAKK